MHATGNRWTCSRARNFPGKRLAVGEGNNFLYHSALQSHLFYFVTAAFQSSKGSAQVTCNYVSHKSTLPREAQICFPTKRTASITTCLACLSNSLKLSGSQRCLTIAWNFTNMKKGMRLKIPSEFLVIHIHRSTKTIIKYNPSSTRKWSFTTFV